jgi:hypothetical protein
MKFLYLSLLLFLLPQAISAQNSTSTTSPNVTIVKKVWYMEVNNPAFEKSPFGAVDEMQQLNRDRRAVRKENERRIKRGLPALRTPVSTRQSQQGNLESPNIYTYKLKIKNDGDKEIKSLIWDFVFYEFGTTNEVGRIQFEYKITIGSGKTKDLAISTEIPPSETINVKETGKKLRDQYTDQVIFQSIEYSDGSVWKNITETENVPKTISK